MTALLTRVFALLFIFKLRCNQAKNIFDYVGKRYGRDEVRLAHKFISTSKKVTKCNLDLEFLIKCKTYNVLPKFVRFKLYKRSLQTSNFYKSWQTKLLNNEINAKKKAIKLHERNLTSALATVHNSVSTIDRWILLRCADQQVSDFKKTTSLVHQRKLATLGISNDIAPCDPDSVIFNFSSTNISDRTKTLLAYGLDFVLPVYKLNFFSYFLAFEKLAASIKSKYGTLPNYEDLRKQLQSLSYRYFYGFKSFKVFSSVFSKNDIQTLKDLSSNPDLIISRPDKGKGVVLVDKNDYVRSMESIIDDRSKFLPLDIPISKYCLKIETKINTFLKKIRSSEFITDDLYRKLFVSGSGPGILYGLPKIHKIDFSTKFQFRPIFAAYNTPSFNIAKFLVPILNPFTKNQYTIENSYSFSKEICNIPNANDYFMASFDIESLFTNVPLQETIDICLDNLFIQPSTTILGLSRKLFRSLLELAVMNSFLFLTINFTNK